MDQVNIQSAPQVVREGCRHRRAMAIAMTTPAALATPAPLCCRVWHRLQCWHLPLQLSRHGHEQLLCSASRLAPHSQHPRLLRCCAPSTASWLRAEPWALQRECCQHRALRQSSAAAVLCRHRHRPHVHCCWHCVQAQAARAALGWAGQSGVQLRLQWTP